MIPSSQEGTVFIVDDDEAVRAALKFSLEIDGHTVEVHENGKALFQRAESPMTGCLVLEQALPDINGLQLVQELRRRHVDLPAILVTTQPSRDVRTEAAAAGVPIVEKPLLTDTLLVTVEEALALHANGPAS
ncbi:MAG TPA: response regulator [Phenylobacterium sp.]|nr:response regulator [Phenylobacterium sp.]